MGSLIGVFAHAHDASLTEPAASQPSFLEGADGVGTHAEESNIGLDFGKAVVAGGELQVEAIARTDFARPAVTRIAYSVVDEQGNAVAKPVFAPQKAVEKGKRDGAESLKVAARLPDGLYQVRATIVGFDGEVDSAAERELYLRVTKGAVQTLTADEWFKTSTANMAQSK